MDQWSKWVKLGAMLSVEPWLLNFVFCTKVLTTNVWACSKVSPSPREGRESGLHVGKPYTIHCVRTITEPRKTNKKQQKRPQRYSSSEQNSVFGGYSWNAVLPPSVVSLSLPPLKIREQGGRCPIALGILEQLAHLGSSALKKINQVEMIWKSTFNLYWSCLITVWRKFLFWSQDILQEVFMSGLTPKHLHF